MSYTLTILGCNSALPTVDKNPTAQLLNADERFFLIDCGENTQVQMRKYKIKFQKVSHVFISHLHGDHYFGLIGLIMSMHLLGRDRELHIYAHYPLKEIIYNQIKASNTELNYPLFFHPLPIDSEEILYENDKIKVSNILLDHSLLCSGFLFQEKLCKRKIDKKKIEEYHIPFQSIKDLQNGKDFKRLDGTKIPNDILTTKNRNPYSYAYCSDTRYCESIVHSIKKTTLLYHEATFMEKDKARAYQTFHSTTLDASNIARKSEVGTLLIGHYSQRYSNHDDMLLECKSVFKNTILSKQGMSLDFSQL